MTLECSQQLRQGAFSRGFAPLGDVFHFCSVERVSVVRGWFFGVFCFCATGFVVDSVKVQGNKLSNPSKSFQAYLCGSAQKG